MKPNIVLLATFPCFLLGCHSETDGVISAEEARTKAKIALIVSSFNSILFVPNFVLTSSNCL